MISHLIILSLLSFSFQSLNYTPKHIVSLTLINANKRYSILDTGNYLMGNKNGLLQLNNIFYQANIKTYIYFVGQLSSYDSSFLKIVSTEVGQRFDGDINAYNYIFIIFAVETRRYIYRIGERARNLIKEQELEHIIKTNSKYFEYSDYSNFLKFLNAQLENTILTKVESSKFTIQKLLDYTVTYISYHRNYFIADPHKYLMNKLDFNMAEMQLERLLNKGIKTFIYLVKEIDYYSNNFVKELALKIGMKLYNDSNASNVFVIIFCIDKKRYLYHYGTQIQYHFNINQVDNILKNQGSNFSGGYYHNVIMALLQGL